MSKAYTNHLKDDSSLVTTYEETRAGFVALALERNRRATPFVAQARALKVTASQAQGPYELLDIKKIQPALLTAAGVSDKAAGHMLPEDKVDAIKGFIKNFLEPAGKDFVEELVFRFLLTRGDTLGGSMRNIGGVLAERKLTRSIISSLTLAGISYYWLHSKTKKWIKESDDDADIELHLKGLAWSNGGKKRTVIYNINVPLVKKNIDLCMLDCSYTDFAKVHKIPEKYVALGELKGGIDPAGADEHWKTARTALSRIRKAFNEKELSPHTFFVGAAIAKNMAGEIWEHLETGKLSNAANLTDSDQVASLCNWLANL